MIPDEAVEAAAKVLAPVPTVWEGLPDKFRAEYLDIARAALEAAAPYMLADAWDAGHTHCFHVEDPRNKERNPYR